MNLQDIINQKLMDRLDAVEKELVEMKTKEKGNNKMKAVFKREKTRINGNEIIVAYLNGRKVALFGDGYDQATAYHLFLKETLQLGYTVEFE